LKAATDAEFLIALGSLFHNVEAASKKMRKFITFITAVCVLFLIKLRWPRNKSLYDVVAATAKALSVYNFVLYLQSVNSGMADRQ